LHKKRDGREKKGASFSFLFTFFFFTLKKKAANMNLFTAASSSDDEENEHPLRSFIPAAAKSPQPISPSKWGLPGDEEDDEEEEGGREEARQQREAATTTETKASAPAAGTAAARKTPSKTLASPKDAHEASRGETEQGLTHLGGKRQLVLHPPPATKATANEDEGNDEGGDDKTPTAVKKPKAKNTASSPLFFCPSGLLQGALPLHVTPRAVSAKEDTFLVEIASRAFDVAGASGVVGRCLAASSKAKAPESTASASASSSSNVASLDLLGQVYDLEKVPCASTLLLVTVLSPPSAAAAAAKTAKTAAAGGGTSAAAAFAHPPSGAVAKVDAAFSSFFRADRQGGEGEDFDGPDENGRGGPGFYFDDDDGGQFGGWAPSLAALGGGAATKKRPAAKAKKKRASPKGRGGGGAAKKKKAAGGAGRGRGKG
jgi:hypothetical protein